MELSDERFDELVEEALLGLPDALVENIDNLVFIVEDEPEDGSDTLGWYEGTALTERETYGYGQLPDRIVLFKGPLERLCHDEDELVEEMESPWCMNSVTITASMRTNCTPWVGAEHEREAHASGVIASDTVWADSTSGEYWCKSRADPQP